MQGECQRGEPWKKDLQIISEAKSAQIFKPHQAGR